MNRDAMQKLRLDRRLIRRRGWIGEAELKRELDGLTDVGHKATTLGDVADERESAASSAGEASSSS
jgi:hypothetical protein